MYSIYFSELLKHKRSVLNISQSQAAKLCYLSKASYNHLEQGIRLPSLETLIRLSHVLKTEPSELLDAIMHDIDLSQDTIGILEESTPLYSTKNKSFEESFQDSFEQLNMFQQKAVLDIMDSLISTNSINVNKDLGDNN